MPPTVRPPVSAAAAVPRHLAGRLAVLIALVLVAGVGSAGALPAAADSAAPPLEESSSTPVAETGAPSSDPALTAMEALPDMVGKWEGTGWIRQGPGEPVSFHSRESVESRLDGRALLIEGLHHARSSDGDAPGPVVHHALALLTWDQKAGLYRFRTYVTGRGDGDFEGRMEDGAFVWGGDTPSGPMRYTIRIDGDTWTETGEISLDGGQTWLPFFGMDLKRVGR